MKEASDVTQVAARPIRKAAMAPIPIPKARMTPVNGIISKQPMQSCSPRNANEYSSWPLLSQRMCLNAGSYKQHEGQ